MGGLALIMMLVAARSWRRRVLVVAAGGFLPVAYEIFRMGLRLAKRRCWGSSRPATRIARYRMTSR